MKAYTTVLGASEAEFTEKKSRFIGRCFPVETEDEAFAVIADVKKRHWDATHNCYAFIVGENGLTQRFSDDGEPSGTAGMPILDVIKQKGLTNTLIVVTRYFGGILLGAGGLVRAYSKAAASAVDCADMVRVEPAAVMTVEIDYSRYGSLEGYIRQRASVDEVLFSDVVSIRALVPTGDVEAFIADITERTDGRAKTERIGEAALKKRT